ncbi:MAG: DNA repair protein RecN [Candidatus Kapabacteria bacterium]|nr:DNA repair protein RecN [Candidatus Kapabacteria bacterium]
MLRRLSIRSFALIDAIDLEIDAGMTVLLGETGAGKSIIVDALAAALGERIGADSLRTGAKKAVLEATFDTSTLPEVQKLLVENDLSWDSEDLVLRRELTASGTSRCFVNDTPAQVSVVREISAHLIDFHGQHDTHGLLNIARHRTVLDVFALAPKDLAEMSSAWSAYSLAQQQLIAIKARARTADADRARLEFIAKEIASTAPSPDEDIQIEADLLRAESSEQVIVLASTVRDTLYSGDVSAYDLVQQARESLRHLVPYHNDLRQALEDLEGALITCKETAASVAPFTEPEDFSPERLEELRQRQVLLQRLVRKYGTLQAAITEQERVSEELALLENLDETVFKAETHVAEAHAKAEAVAKRLSKLRRKSAPELSATISAALAEMGMPSATFNIQIETDALGQTGSDRVEFTFTSNAGEPLRPLSKVASGGELSRVMLSIKRALASHGNMGTMVFDEIDTGISGRVARTVGEVMKGLSEQQQILCITHLAQIASLANNFVRVTKIEMGGSTTVSAESIDETLALVEIAKLLSGSEVTDVSISGAKELMTEPVTSRPRSGR